MAFAKNMIDLMMSQKSVGIGLIVFMSACASFMENENDVSEKEDTEYSADTITAEDVFNSIAASAPAP